MVLTLGLFVAGTILGVAAQILSAGVSTATATSAPPAKLYRSLSQVREPGVAAQLAEAMRQDDASALALLVNNPDTLKRLRSSIEPIVDVSAVVFQGATQGLDGEIISAYVIRGRDRTGFRLVRGFVVNVLRDEIIGVNR